MRGYLRNEISHIVHNSQKLLDHFGEVKVSRNLVSTNDVLEGVICRQRFSAKKNICSANDHFLFREHDAIYTYYIMKLIKQVAMRIEIF